MKKKSISEAESGVLAFYKDKKKWVLYEEKEAPDIKKFGLNNLVHNATDWIVEEIMHNDMGDGVKLEFWAIDDGGKKNLGLIVIEGMLTQEKEGTWVDVKIRMPWMVI